ncbi:MAG: endolytic transglycosylase MltG, partial [Clostridia bacterium]|nr:endolytic transglycosylase MltG [Clostridia bacterium]
MEHSENSRENQAAEKLSAARRKKYRRRKIMRILRPVLIYGISIAICFLIARVAINYALDEYVRPVDSSDATPITVTIEKGSGASTIAKLLYEAGGEGNVGLIKSKAAFKIYVDFTGKSSILKSGTYVLSRNMDIPQMVDIICMGNPARQTVKFTVPEGMEIEDMADRLVELGILESKTEFLSLCETGEAFSEYSFVNAILQSEDAGSRRYALEGYLFPDTYEVYVGASAKSIITKMLIRFNEVFNDEYMARAQELNMSVDDVVTLASIIEREAKTADFAKVSAVFHNRMDEGMRLQSDAPLKYIFRTENVLDFTSEQMEADSPYNTYKVDGLPVGAIDNPGNNAIYAALYPDEEYMEDGYLYFVLKS